MFRACGALGNTKIAGAASGSFVLRGCGNVAWGEARASGGLTASTSASPNDHVDLLGFYGGTSSPDTFGPGGKLTLRCVRSIAAHTLSTAAPLLVA